MIDKGSYIGAHIISGNVFQPTALNELIPDWKDKEAPLHTEVTSDEFMFLRNETSAIKVPHIFMPKSIDNHGNYIISLSELTMWLGEQAEELGVEILTGFAGNETIFDEKGERVVGVRTGDMGIAKDGTMKDSFEPGVEILAKQTIFAEGARGSLTERLKDKFNLEKDCKGVQHYGIGLKEVW